MSTSIELAGMVFVGWKSAGFTISIFLVMGLALDVT
jgi:hypothetical protein